MPLYLPSPVNEFAPADHGIIAWSYDPAAASASAAPATGVIQLIKVVLRTPATITNLIVEAAVAGSVLTTGQNFAALFDSSGTRQGITADQTTPWGTAGLYTMALTAPYAAAAGSYYVALLSNGNTSPAFARSTGITSANALVNVGLSVSTARFATNGSGVTSVPSSITMSSNTLGTSSTWAAVS